MAISTATDGRWFVEWRTSHKWKQEKWKRTRSRTTATVGGTDDRMVCDEREKNVLVRSGQKGGALGTRTRFKGRRPTTGLATKAETAIWRPSAGKRYVRWRPCCTRRWVCFICLFVYSFFFFFYSCPNYYSC